MPKTPYDGFKEKYVILRTDSGFQTGLLIRIDLDVAVLNPSIMSYDAGLISYLQIAETDNIVPYLSIKGVRVLDGGKGYMSRLVNDSLIGCRFSVQMRLQELRSKGIGDKNIEASLERFLSSFSDV